jgi:sialic acid synthase SpsE
MVGETIKFSDLVFRKPVRILDSVDFEKVIGCTASKNVAKFTPVTFSDLEK